MKRRRIVDVLADPALPAETRRRLELAWRARQFGIDKLGLRDGDNFDRYVETNGAPIAWNLTAAYADRLELVSLQAFRSSAPCPISGFSKRPTPRPWPTSCAHAGSTSRCRYPVAGYSTLGYFADPIYSSMLDGPDERIVEVVLHEMLHGTVYIKGESSFNESLATFVGLQGAALFFSAAKGQQAGRAVLEEADEATRFEEAFSDFLRGVLAQLKALYAEPISHAEKLTRRQAVFAAAQVEYRRRFPPAPNETATFLAEPLNNALLLSYAVYHEDSGLHRQLFARVGNNLAAFVRLYRVAAKRREAQAWLTEIADGKREVPKAAR